MSKQIIIFSSTNPGKIEEFKRLINLDPTIYTILSILELGYEIPVCNETGSSFIENAKLKVNHTRNHLKPQHKNSFVIGDDSGVCINALDGMPGVHTRRWAGHRMTDREFIDYCLKSLKDHSDRSAEYVSVYAIKSPSKDELEIIEGRTEGVILSKPKNESYVEGIPFRCLFYIPALKMMFHEARTLTPDKRKFYKIGQDDAIAKCRLIIVRNTQKT